jgi:hypothetical protein
MNVKDVRKMLQELNNVWFASYKCGLINETRFNKDMKERDYKGELASSRQLV